VRGGTHFSYATVCPPSDRSCAWRTRALLDQWVLRVTTKVSDRSHPEPGTRPAMTEIAHATSLPSSPIPAHDPNRKLTVADPAGAWHDRSHATRAKTAVNNATASRCLNGVTTEQTYRHIFRALCVESLFWIRRYGRQVLLVFMNIPAECKVGEANPRATVDC
jgi:hypothetical protein